MKRTGEPVTVTKRGRTVARIIPAGLDTGVLGLDGTVEILGDIDSPVLSPEAWEAEGGDTL